MSVLDDQQKRDLQNMIDANDTEDLTQYIRAHKRSDLVAADIRLIAQLKVKHNHLLNTDPVGFDELCSKQCPFLYNSFRDIYNKIKTGALDINTMHKFLAILKRIEDGELDQHEGSYLAGKHLNNVHIDGSLRNKNNTEPSDNKKDSDKPAIPSKTFSYKEFKNLQK